MLVCALLVGGCTMAPKYERPASPVSAQWPSGAAYDPTKVSKPGTPEGEDLLQLRWREFFTDPKLRQLIGIALENNRQLKSARLSVEYYRELYNIQTSDLFPRITGGLGMSAQRMPADLSATGRRATMERYDANLGAASWEVDFFGRIRSLKEAALQEYFATEQASRSAQISIISAVAHSYLNIASAQECVALDKELVASYRDTYERVKRNYDLGLVSEIDVSRSASQVAVAERSAAVYLQLLAQSRNALEFLLGAPVPEELLPESLTGLAPAREVSAGISSEILLKRPDVLAAENQLLAANANIGAARAAYFPRISLTAAIGSASSELSGLFKSGSGYWSYAPQLALPIFDMRTWASHRASKVKKEMMISEYEKAIQSAFRDVADVLATLGTIDKQVTAQEEYVAAVKRTYELANYRYESEIDNYLSLLDAQRSLHSSEQSLVMLVREKFASQIDLYTVLGGGWEESPDELEESFQLTETTPSELN
jgi:multidrug efflux system outer membrane protein